MKSKKGFYPKGRRAFEECVAERDARFREDAPATNIAWLGSRRHPVAKHIWLGRPVSGGDTAPYSGPKETIVKTHKGGRKIILAKVVVQPNIRPAKSDRTHEACRDARRDSKNICAQCRQALKQPSAAYHTTASEWDAKQRDQRAAAFNAAPPAVKFSKSNEVGD